MIVCGDNLKIMRSMDNESIDLIYLDPPFNSNTNYKGSNGSEFKDKWSVEDIDASWLCEITRWYPKVNDLLKLAGDTHSVSMASYLAYMGIRIIEMERLLKDTGSIYLHCDPTSSHYLRLLMDAVFGSKNFRNEIIWFYRKWSNNIKCWQRNHDVILLYSKGKNMEFNTQYAMTESKKKIIDKGWQINKPSGKRQLIVYDWNKVTNIYKIRHDSVVDRTNANPGSPVPDVWSDINYISSGSKQRTGYPTQKPIALLERIIKASSNEGDVVLDPFCGSGTTLVCAKRLGRNFIGIDISENAIKVTGERMEKDRDLIGSEK